MKVGSDLLVGLLQVLVRPSRKGILLDPFPFGIGLEVTFGVGHGLVGVDDNERVVIVVAVVLVLVPVGLTAASRQKVQSCDEYFVKLFLPSLANGFVLKPPTSIPY